MCMVEELEKFLLPFFFKFIYFFTHLRIWHSRSNKIHRCKHSESRAPVGVVSDDRRLLIYASDIQTRTGRS